jgi:hypothetical protein
MSLTDSLDAALAVATEKQARPFRFELQPDQVEALRTGGLLSEPPLRWATAHGVYKDVAVYWAIKDSELLAQPTSDLLAIRIPIGV